MMGPGNSEWVDSAISMGTGAAQDTMISKPMRTNMIMRLAFRDFALEGGPQSREARGRAMWLDAKTAERFPMTALISISHVTRYRYDNPVAFGAHRLLVRPRDGHDLRVLETHLVITPKAKLHWQFDAFGNSVAHAVFAEPSDRLEITSDLLIRRYPGHSEISPPDRAMSRMPLEYGADDLTDLAPYIPMQFPQEREALARWLSSEFQNRPAGMLEFLNALSAAIHAAFSYSRREERGTQSAMTTVGLKSGTCRDFAFLFMECARLFGFAARFVTGYLHVRESAKEMLKGGGSTHAWADVYVPGEGWVEFDPTNLIVGNQALIRIAVTRTPAQATPISGTYDREQGRFLGMSVDVSVRELDES
jgi:transglutaminase-like putative cysteine protease